MGPPADFSVLPLVQDPPVEAPPGFLNTLFTQLSTRAESLITVRSTPDGESI